MRTQTKTWRNTHTYPRIALLGLILVGAAIAFAERARAQEEFVPLTATELEALVGPIALYPDDIVGVVLPASTYPIQIVQAARFLEERALDESVQPDEEWDDAVVALLNYPEVVRLMNDDLDWTWALGEAVLNEQAAVIGAIQVFRDRAYAAGNLASDDRQIVSESDGVIAIEPADPEVVYIPYYEPETVVVYQPAPVYHYYPRAYPLYYYPYPVGYHFANNWFWGVTSAFSIGWRSHYLHVHHNSHYGHRYYGHNYYTPYYHRRGININININNARNVWQPRNRRGARPYDGYRARTGDRVTRTYDGRRYRYSDGTRNNTGQRVNNARPQVSGGGTSRRATTDRGTTTVRNPAATGSSRLASGRRSTTGTRTGSGTVRSPAANNNSRSRIGGIAPSPNADSSSVRAGNAATAPDARRSARQSGARPSRSTANTQRSTARTNGTGSTARTNGAASGRSAARTLGGRIGGVARPSTPARSTAPARSTNRTVRQAAPSNPTASRSSGQRSSTSQTRTFGARASSTTRPNRAASASRSPTTSAGRTAAPRQSTAPRSSGQRSSSTQRSSSSNSQSRSQGSRGTSSRGARRVR